VPPVVFFATCGASPLFIAPPPAVHTYRSSRGFTCTWFCIYLLPLRGK
jgi:hypothetical protein